MRQALLALVHLALGLALGPALAHADENDLVLNRLGEINGAGTDVIPHNQNFRSLVSELAVVVAPKFLSPADTLGFAGFQFDVELAYTTINSDQGYWCATEQSVDCAPGFERSGGMLTMGVFARKGIWLPVPSFEVGAGAIQVLDSRMWAAQVYGKLALHEGYHNWPLPSLAVRGSGVRLMGSEQLDLTIASIDVSISKDIGIGGTVNLAPYVGGNFLWIVPRSEVLDKTPQVDAFMMPTDINMNFVFPEQDDITRMRVFGGFKLKYYVFTLVAEVDWALPGDSVDDRGGTDVACDAAPATDQGRCDATDQSGTQRTFAFAVALDF